MTALRELWRARGPVAEGYRNLTEALRRAGDLLPERRVAALRAAALTALHLGEAAEAERLARELLELTRARGDATDEIAALIELAHAVAALGEGERAQHLMEEAIATARAVGDRDMLGNALGSAGVLAAMRGERRRAVELLEQCLAEAGDALEARGRAWALANLAAVLAELGEVDRAVETAREGLEVARARGDMSVVAMLLEALAYAEAGRDAIRAARLLGAAAALMEELGSSQDTDVLAAVRAAAAEDFEQAFAEGATLTVDDALELALAPVG